jgi:hypothetical protein
MFRSKLTGEQQNDIVENYTQQYDRYFQNKHKQLSCRAKFVKFMKMTKTKTILFYRKELDEAELNDINIENFNDAILRCKGMKASIEKVNEQKQFASAIKFSKYYDTDTESTGTISVGCSSRFVSAGSTNDTPSELSGRIHDTPNDSGFFD